MSPHRILKYNPDPFNAPGRWLRCNFHAHSTDSDGHLSPQDLAALYRGEGYDVLCLTEHLDASDHGLSDEKILVLPGQEMGPIGPPSDHGRFHLTGINLKRQVPAGELLPNMAISEVNAQGGAAVLAHPAWGGHHLDEMLGLEGFIGIEVFNNLSNKSARGYSEQIWDQIIDLRGPVWGLAVDDIHGSDAAFGGWVWLKAAERTPEAVVRALRSGSFYSSQGPTIARFDLELVLHTKKNGEKTNAWKVSAETSPAASISFTTNADWGRRFPAPDGETISSAERILPQWARWVRLTAVDPAGRKAWANPLMVPPAPPLEE